jgi:Ca-activated chloride channel family protein
MKIRALVKPYMRACVLGALLVPAVLYADAETGVWAQRWRDLWLTPDQQAQRLFNAGDYAAAAVRFSDPMRIGTAWYRAGEFERAAAAFGQLASAEGHFNRANALLMQGHYDEAIEAYGQALQQRPDWQLAIDNRDLAVARQARLAPPEDDAGGTGGKLEADEIVFDNTGRTSKVGNEQVTGGDTGLTDARMRDLWLRRVETKPADFLRARFARQLDLQTEAVR